MSAYNGYSGYVNIQGGYNPTPGNGGNIFITGGTGSTGYVTATTGGWNTSFVGYNNWPASKRAIKILMAETRKWAEDFCKKSPNYDETLKGFSALASRDLYKRMIEEGYEDSQLMLGYIRNKHCSHVFLIYDHQLLDVCAHLFGCDHTEPVKLRDIDIDETPWWDSSINYASQSGLIARQRRDGWPEHQITLSAAKTRQLPAVSFSDTEDTDLDKMVFKVPFDSEAEAYFKKQSKTDGFKTNLAALLLSNDPEIVKLATKLSKKVLG